MNLNQFGLVKENQHFCYEILWRTFKQNNLKQSNNQIFMKRHLGMFQGKLSRIQNE